MSAKFIGIYGGTFDPVHLGHITAASEVRERLGLDEVRMVLSANPPHRKQPVLSAKDRFALLTLAVNGLPYLVPDDCEIHRAGPSYMVDTLRYFRQQNPSSSIMLILGMEAFNGLMSWHQWVSIIDLAHIVVTNRAGFNNQFETNVESYVAPYLTEDKSQLKQQTHGKIYVQPVSAIDISATQIRQRIIDKKLVKQMLVPTCWEMIQQNAFYR